MKNKGMFVNKAFYFAIVICLTYSNTYFLSIAESKKIQIYYFSKI